MTDHDKKIASLSTRKNALAELNRHTVATWKRTGSENHDDTLIITPPAKWPWALHGRAKYYHKKHLPLQTSGKSTSGKSKSEIILYYENEHLTSFTWRTSAEHLEKAAEWGIISHPHQSLTQDILGTLGQYRQITLARAHDSGIISNHYQEKINLLDIAQKRIKALQTLERLINNSDLLLENSPDQQYQYIENLLDEYSNTLDNLKQSLLKWPLTLQQPQNHLIPSLFNDQQTIKQYREQLNTLKNKAYHNRSAECIHAITAPYGRAAILGLIKRLARKAIEDLKYHNRNLTYAVTLLQGDMRKYVEEALRRVDDDELYRDLHHPTLPAHQGLFSASCVTPASFTDPEFKPSETETTQHPSSTLFDLEFSASQYTPQEIRRILRTITAIEGIDTITASLKPTLLTATSTARYNVKQHIPLVPTRFTKWRHSQSTLSLLNIGIATLNFVTGLFGGVLIDLPVGLIGGLLGYRPAAIVARCQIQLYHPLAKTLQQTRAAWLEQHFNMQPISLGLKVGVYLSQFLRNSLWEVGQSIFRGIQTNTLDLFKEIRADWSMGHRNVVDPLASPLASIRPILQALKQCKARESACLEQITALLPKLTKIEQDNHTTHHTQAPSTTAPNHITPSQGSMPSDKQTTSPAQSSSATTEPTTTPSLFEQWQQTLSQALIPLSLPAVPPYLLSGGEWRDMLNAMVSGSVSFFKVFADQLYASHPLTGLCFTLAYLAGAIAILNPHLVAFLGQAFSTFSQSLGQLMAHGTASVTISAGFTEAQIATGLVEALLHGPKSWLATTYWKLAQDPANIITYGALAVGLGYLLTFKLNIPGLSEHLRAGLGHMPFLTEGVAGLKFAALLLEALRKHLNNVPAYQHNIAELMQNLKNILCQVQSADQGSSHTTQKASAQPEEDAHLSPLDHLKQVITLFTQPDQSLSWLLNTKQEQPSKHDIELDHLTLLVTLRHAMPLLPKLPLLEKYQLIHHIKRLYPALATTLTNTLFPAKSYAVFGTTIKIILDYPPLLIRCLASMVTWHAYPWLALGRKISHDLASVCHAIHHLLHSTIMLASRVVSAIIQVPCYNIAARAELLIRRNKHSLSTLGHRISSSYNEKFTMLNQRAMRLFSPIYQSQQQKQFIPAVDQTIKKHFQQYITTHYVSTAT